MCVHVCIYLLYRYRLIHAGVCKHLRRNINGSTTQSHGFLRPPTNFKLYSYCCTDFCCETLHGSRLLYMHILACLLLM